MVYLNGPSSSGKHSIVGALQAQMPGPWFNTGVDTWFANIPKRFMGDGPYATAVFPWVFDRDGTLLETATGPLGQRLMRGMYSSVAALAAAGNHVIVDDVMYESWMIPACAETLAGSHAYFIGVHCRLEICAAREHARGDRPPGLAACNHHLVHRNALYDLEVDTSGTSAEACAARIRTHLADHPPLAFRRLATQNPG